LPSEIPQSCRDAHPVIGRDTGRQPGQCLALLLDGVNLDGKFDFVT
jgi:hypothetical protein